VVALIAATALELLLRARTMTGALASALAALPVVLAQTHFGRVTTARALALAVLLVLTSRHGRAARAAALGTAALVALTTSLGGHAADWGDATPAVASDWIHMMAAAVWTGGLLGLALAVLPDRGDWPPALLPTIARRFSRLAGGCVLAIVATGVYNAWLQVRTPAALATTAYGRVLVAKVLMAVVVIGLGAVNRYVIVARLAGRARPFQRLRRARDAAAGSPARQASRLATYVGAEAALAVAIFGLTAILVESTPARHAERHHHDAAASPPATYVAGRVPP
jgi:putative copper export protein